MTMPGDILVPVDTAFESGTSYFGKNLTAYVENGTISEARVDDMGRFSMSTCNNLLTWSFSYSYYRWMVPYGPRFSVLSQN